MNEAIIMNVIENYFKEHYPDMKINYSNVMGINFCKYSWRIDDIENPRYKHKFIVVNTIDHKTYFWVHNLKKMNVIKNQLVLLGLTERKYI